jgi:hypothetical protein
MVGQASEKKGDPMARMAPKKRSKRALLLLVLTLGLTAGSIVSTAATADAYWGRRWHATPITSFSRGWGKSLEATGVFRCSMPASRLHG